MTPVLVRDEAPVSELDSYRPHVMQLVRCRECGRKHLSVHHLDANPDLFQCIFCMEMSCEPVTGSLPVEMRPGQSVHDALRAIGMRTME